MYLRVIVCMYSTDILDSAIRVLRLMRGLSSHKLLESCSRVIGQRLSQSTEYSARTAYSLSHEMLKAGLVCFAASPLCRDGIIQARSGPFRSCPGPVQARRCFRRAWRRAFQGLEGTPHGQESLALADLVNRESSSEIACLRAPVGDADVPLIVVFGGRPGRAGVRAVCSAWLLALLRDD